MILRTCFLSAVLLASCRNYTYTVRVDLPCMAPDKALRMLDQNQRVVELCYLPEDDDKTYSRAELRAIVTHSSGPLNKTYRSLSKEYAK